MSSEAVKYLGLNTVWFNRPTDHWPTKPEDRVEQVCPAEIQIIYSQRSNTDWAKQDVSELRESALCDVQDKAGVEPV